MINFNFENLKKLEEAFWYVNEYNYSADARDIYFILSKLLSVNSEKHNNELVNDYLIYKAKFGFVALSLLPAEEIFDLFENYLNIALTIPYYDLWENLKKYLIVLADYEERDKIKLRIRDILIKNKAKVTKENLILNQKEVSGTLENWIIDYHNYVGTRMADKLVFEQYFINTSNINGIKEEEKKKLKSILQFHEKLKLSSKTPLGFEEEVPIVIKGNLKIWREGRLENIDPEIIKTVRSLREIKTISSEEEYDDRKPKSNGLEKMVVEEEKVDESRIQELKDLASSLNSDSLERRAIEEEIRKLSQ